MSLAHPEDDVEDRLEKRLLELGERLSKFQEEIEKLRILYQRRKNQSSKYSSKYEYESPLHYPPPDCDSFVGH